MRRPIARHRALWAFNALGPVLVATDCAWVAAALPLELVVDEDRLTCPRCRRECIDVPPLAMALEELKAAY